MAFKPINIVINQNTGIKSIRTDDKSIKINILSNQNNAKASLRESGLNSHNKFRSLHKNTPMMVWDEEIASGAQQWAEEISKNGKLKHGTKGENIFMCRSSSEIDNEKACNKAVESWYSEINNYDYNSRKSTNEKPTGHFTQVIWCSSTKLGVGISRVQRNNIIETYVVSRYGPPGNLVGAHDKNVFLPKSLSSQNGNQQQQQQTKEKPKQVQQTNQRKTAGNIKESTIQAHNSHRSKHGSTPMLEWDDELAMGAQKWAENISKEGKMKHGAKGENIFMCCSSNVLEDGKVCEKAVQSWYSEIQNYDFNNHVSTNEKPIGHFTQVVWASSKKVGAGIATMKADGMIKTFLVARYDPPGNLKGAFQQNVSLAGNQSEPAKMQESATGGGTAVNSVQPQTKSSPEAPNNAPNSSTDVKEISLQAHNKYRSQHKNTPMLTWDDELAKGAQKWAKKICKEGKMKHGSKGENIFMCCSSANINDTVACERAVQSWYSEIKDYDFSSHSSTNGNPTGHFTQVVWSSSTKLGVGIARAQSDGMVKTFVVARYGPNGNLQGAYQQNVNNKI